MDSAARERLLRPPAGRVCAVLDTDTYNEVDDQFALAYLLASRKEVCLEAVYAAPFLNEKSSSPEDGMKKSLEEIGRVLDLAGRSEYRQLVCPGAVRFLTDEETPEESPAAEDLIRRARAHSPEEPLYVVGIAAATNIASAILMAPDILERIVVVWLGGPARFRQGEAEFNMKEDYAAARVLMRSGAALVHVPCQGVAEYFSVSRPELERHLAGKGALADYLAQITIREAEAWSPGLPWTKTIWDMTAAAYLTDREERFLGTRLEPAPVPEPDATYAEYEGAPLMRTVYRVKRDELMADLFAKLTGGEKASRRVLSMGSMNLDHTYQVEHFLAPGETASALSYERHAGGKGLNQALALARAGADVTMAGCVGADGEPLLSFLADNGLDDSLVRRLSVPTGHTVIQVDRRGENCILAYKGANHCLTREQIADSVGRFSPGDVLLLQNETNLLPELVRAGKEAGLVVFLNPSPVTKELAREVPLSLADWLILNEVELAALAGTKESGEGLDRLLGRYPDLRIVLTLGGEGAIYADRRERHCQKAFPVRPVDTTAAGDTFTGYFIETWLRTGNIRAALARAARAASIAITRAGAAGSIPLAQEVDQEKQEEKTQ